MKIDGYSYRNDQGEWVNLINPRLIPAPTRPVEPEYESEDLPDQKHVWNEDGWDGDHHSGSVCSVCFYHSECQWCEPEDLESEGCLRKQAHARNCQLRGAHKRSMAVYEAQMEYYNSVIVPLGDL